jgi:type IV pilus assembly protein PilM
MADTQTTVALNIGSQRIGMAVFEVSKTGGLVLKAYDSESIVADPAMDASRIAQTRVAIADLAGRLKVGKVKARYAISGQAVFTRFVKLPPLPEDNLEQVVTFEAQQHVPFPLNEVVWDYELIEGAADKEVVIVAIKSDALDEINTAVNDSGMGTCEVDVAPMATYNAFRSTYGQPEEPILLIDIGAKTSNLLYIEGKRFFTRSIAIGGASVTAAIAKEYNVSFVEAEHQKISNGLVALGGGHTEQLDEAVAALAMVIRNALSRLPAEIARTTNYYRSQHGGSAPRRILLAGGGANLPYTLEFFQEKLNLPVEYFNPVRNVAIGKGVDASVVQREGHLMGELVGLGLRGIGKSEINIDLVPVVVEQSRAADRRKPFFIATAAVLVAGMAAWAAYQNVAASKAKDMARTMMEQRDNLAPLKTKIDGLLKNEADLRQIADGFTGVEADHAFWMDLLAEVRGAFASDAVWLADLEPINGYDPAKALDPGFDPKKTPNGKSVVKPEFFNTPYGASSLPSDIKNEESAQPAQGRKPGNQKGPSPSAGVTANAVRIKGFWRENPKSQTLVSELLKHLRDKSAAFSFTIPDPKDPQKTINLVDDQNLGKIMTITSVSAKVGDLAQPFEITLPLAREVGIK